jgi:hypothetical protein
MCGSGYDAGKNGSVVPGAEGVQQLPVSECIQDAGKHDL